jgi:hypothetical protein
MTLTITPAPAAFVISAQMQTAIPAKAPSVIPA